MQSAFEQLQGFFHGCDYAAALEAERRVRIVLERLREITGSDQEWELEARRLLGGEW